jgi:hypothetical protein
VRRPLPILLASALLLAPATGLAQAATPAAGLEADASRDPLLESRRRDLDDALQRLAKARQRHARAESAYEDWRQRKWPRGEAKAQMLAEREAARAEWEEARGDLPRVIERARRDGLPPGELRPYEEVARAEMASR